MNQKNPKQRSVLIIVENLPVPFDRRVWQEATALKQAGYGVSVICPKGKGQNLSEETIDGIHVYRHSLPFEAEGGLGYLVEYSFALFWEFWLSMKVLRHHGFDVIHACNPPDLIYLIAVFHKVVFGKKFIFDQHDLNPELYELKFSKRGFFHKLLCHFERRTFHWADASIATNQTFKQIAIDRGGMAPDKVWIVKSYPDLERFKRVDALPELHGDFKHLIGYVGIIANQDGVDLLVKAMSHIVKTYDRHDCGCVIIGDGPAYESLRILAKELAVERYVKFTGYLRGQELLSHLSSLDIGVIPDPSNPCNDKLSMNKVFEYMALGLPFVQFNLPQSSSEAADAAFVARECSFEALAEVIIKLVDDPAARKRMSAYGIERANREFQWVNEKTSLLSAYSQVLGLSPEHKPALPEVY
jgi:glycosyltransferase involved in cell wall biosynthesis